MITNVYGCARCGANHTELEFKQFTNGAVTDPDGNWPYWGMCPTLSEPILLRLNPADRKQVALPQVAPVLCLDLDGTVRTSRGGHKFIEGADNVLLYPDVEKVLWKFRDDGFVVVGITNQGGVAWGYKTPGQVEAEHRVMLDQFAQNPFHMLFSCYHDPRGDHFPYNYRSLCRKPDIGMLALVEHRLWEINYIADWDNSLFVGDRAEDEQCAKRAGVVFIHAHHFFSRPQPPSSEEKE
ncbi:MAG: HAD-IIIA family hydrolase [Anaerolineae bacterium]|nr:HAD-IIIA family hydrolase [Anaerolineae bacterium]